MELEAGFAARATSTGPQPHSARVPISAARRGINLAWQNAATPLASTRTAIGTICVDRRGVLANRSRSVQCMDGAGVRVRARGVAGVATGS